MGPWGGNGTGSWHVRAEAASKLRDNEAEFARIVSSTLRGGTVGGRRFPKFK
jgi:hypothetical protein